MVSYGNKLGPINCLASSSRTYPIAVTGLGAGAAARYRLSNGDMKPLDWAVRADARDRFAR